MGGILANSVPMAGSFAGGYMQGMQQRDTHDLARQNLSMMQQNYAQSQQRFPIEMQQLRDQVSDAEAIAPFRRLIAEGQASQYAPTGNAADLINQAIGVPGLTQPDMSYNRSKDIAGLALNSRRADAANSNANRPRVGSDPRWTRLNTVSRLVQGLKAAQTNGITKLDPAIKVLMTPEEQQLVSAQPGQIGDLIMKYQQEEQQLRQALEGSGSQQAAPAGDKAAAAKAWADQLDAAFGLDKE